MHIRPADVEGMTIGEIEICLDDDTKRSRGPDGFVAMSPGELKAHAERRRTMSLADKIAEAKRA